MALVFPPALGNIPSPSSLTPTILGTAFYAVTTGGVAPGTHQSTDWQINTSSGFESATFVYNQNDTVNLTNITVPASTLALKTTYYMRFRFRDTLGNISNWSQTGEFNTGLQIDKPSITITSPTQLQPIISSSAYSGVNTHSRTDWQVSTDYYFNTINQQLLDSPTSLTQYSEASGLSYSTLYYVRVRYKDNLGQYSEWSTPASFYTDTSTNVNPQIDRPSIINPVDASSNSSLTPTLTGGAFSGSNNATHVSSTWQIALAPTFGSSSTTAPGATGTTSSQISNTSGLVYEALNDINNKVTLTINPGILEEGKTYYVRVRYQYVDLQSVQWNSEWSEPIYFTTIAVPGEIQCPYISSITESTIYDRMDVVSSAYVATQSTGQSHTYSDWEVATDAGFTNVIIVATNDSVNKTTFPIPTDSIRPSTNYYVRTRYYNGSIWSVFSAGYLFQSPATATGTLQDFTRVQTDTLDDLSVSTNKIINLSVTNEKLADNTLTSQKISIGGIDASASLTDDSVTDAKLNSGTGVEAVVTNTIRNLNVTTQKLADNAVTSDKIDISGAVDPVGPINGQIFYNTAEDTLKTYNGSNWKESGDAGDYYIIQKPTASQTNLTVLKAGRSTNVSYSEYSNPLNTHQFFAPAGLGFDIDSSGHLIVTVR